MKRRGAPSPVTLQFSVKYAMPGKHGPRRRMTKKVIEEAIKWWIDEGEPPNGFEIRPIHWQHEEKTTEVDDPETFREVFGRLVRAGATLRYAVRRHEGV